ncbi:MAG: hypothetical protein IPN11_07485 [Opitutaceae bacterium]|nr:hypothetical protein [Opitutaceae bacterium]
MPGSHEIPVAVQLWPTPTIRLHCRLGVLIGVTRSTIRSGTSVSHAQASPAARIPVINGVVVADTRAQRGPPHRP